MFTMIMIALYIDINFMKHITNSFLGIIQQSTMSILVVL